jgi:hypothetical protein
MIHSQTITQLEFFRRRLQKVPTVRTSTLCNRPKKEDSHHPYLRQRLAKDYETIALDIVQAFHQCHPSEIRYVSSRFRMVLWREVLRNIAFRLVYTQSCMCVFMTKILFYFSHIYILYLYIRNRASLNLSTSILLPSQHPSYIHTLIGTHPSIDSSIHLSHQYIVKE